MAQLSTMFTQFDVWPAANDKICIEMYDTA